MGILTVEWSNTLHRRMIQFINVVFYPRKEFNEKGISARHKIALDIFLSGERKTSKQVLAISERMLWKFIRILWFFIILLRFGRICSDVSLNEWIEIWQNALIYLEKNSLLQCINLAERTESECFLKNENRFNVNRNKTHTLNEYENSSMHRTTRWSKWIESSVQALNVRVNQRRKKSNLFCVLYYGG